MSAVLAARQLPALGAAFEGGFFADRIMVDQRPHAIIVAPKGLGERSGIWNSNRARIAGALSYFDSFANTRAMAEAGSEIAQWALAQRIGGHDDWCIAARDVKERIFRLLKPHGRENYCYHRSGENPSAIPPAYPYTATDPAQTGVALFREDGEEAFEQEAYWTSTQYEGDAGYAWAQGFSGGSQGDCHEVYECRVRLVRTIAI